MCSTKVPERALCLTVSREVSVVHSKLAARHLLFLQRARVHTLTHAGHLDAAEQEVLEGDLHAAIKRLQVPCEVVLLCLA